jgi:hypothetical protein
VTRFLAGFAVGSMIWGGLGAYLVFSEGYGPPSPEEPDTIEVSAAEEPAADTEEASPRRRRRRASGAGSTTSDSPSARLPTGDATTGDDLGEGELRIIDGAGSGGEEQLTGAEIDHAFDGAMPRVRRCFILAAAEAEVTGRLTFGLRIAGTGHVSAVNLAGPAVLTTGECGDCLRDTARAIQFPTFDGPEMVVRYPITLE